MIEGRAYTKDMSRADVIELTKARHGYTPADVIDAGAVWIAQRPEGQDVAQGQEKPATRPGLGGPLLTGRQLRLI